MKGPITDDNRQTKIFRDRYCYGCGKKDHFIRSCPVRNFTSPGSNTKAAILEVSELQKEVGKKTEQDDESHESIDTEEKSVATCIVFTPTSNLYTVAKSQIESETKVHKANKIEIVNISCQGTGEIVSKTLGSMPVREGYVGDSKV